MDDDSKDNLSNFGSQLVKSTTISKNQIYQEFCYEGDSPEELSTALKVEAISKNLSNIYANMKSFPSTISNIHLFGTDGSMTLFSKPISFNKSASEYNVSSHERVVRVTNWDCNVPAAYESGYETTETADMFSEDGNSVLSSDIKHDVRDRKYSSDVLHNNKMLFVKKQFDPRTSVEHPKSPSTEKSSLKFENNSMSNFQQNQPKSKTIASSIAQPFQIKTAITSSTTSTAQSSLTKPPITSSTTSITQSSLTKPSNTSSSTSISQPSQIKSANTTSTISIPQPSQIKNANTSSTISIPQPSQIKNTNTSSTTSIPQPSQIKSENTTSTISIPQPSQIKNAKTSSTISIPQPSHIKNANTSSTTSIPQPSQIKSANTSSTTSIAQPSQIKSANTSTTTSIAQPSKRKPPQTSSTNSILRENVSQMRQSQQNISENLISSKIQGKNELLRHPDKTLLKRTASLQALPSEISQTKSDNSVRKPMQSCKTKTPTVYLSRKLSYQNAAIIDGHEERSEVSFDFGKFNLRHNWIDLSRFLMDYCTLLNVKKSVVAEPLELEKDSFDEVLYNKMTKDLKILEKALCTTGASQEIASSSSIPNHNPGANNLHKPQLQLHNNHASLHSKNVKDLKQVQSTQHPTRKHSMESSIKINTPLVTKRRALVRSTLNFESRRQSVDCTMD